MLTPAQKVLLKAGIIADPITNQLYIDGNLSGLADHLNTLWTPDFWVWRTEVTRADIYTKQNDLGVAPPDDFWNWTTYKNQGIAEQNAWVQMFMNDIANFSQQNLRDGIGKIFTGSAAATAQRNHCLAIGRRLATHAEHMLANGTGTTTSPAIMTFEGLINTADLIGL